MLKKIMYALCFCFLFSSFLFAVSQGQGKTEYFNTSVGIDTTNPIEKLQVIGRIVSSGTYAEIYCNDASTTTVQGIAAGATYVKITAFTTNGLSKNMTADATNDKITITKAGRYRVEGSFSFADNLPNIVWFGAVFLGGTEQDQLHFSRKIGAGGDVGNSGLSGFISVASVPADIDFRVRHNGVGSVDIAFAYANLNCNYLGEI